MNKKIVLLLLVSLVILGMPQAEAFDVTYMPSTTEAMPNSTFSFGEFNVSGENVRNNELAVFVTGPFSIDYIEQKNDTNAIIIFSATIPEHTDENVYSGSITLNYGNESATQQYNISVGEQIFWQIDTTNITITVNPGETRDVNFNITNNGNKQVTLTPVVSEGCVNFTYYQENKIIYPGLKNRYLMTFDIPYNWRTVTDYCTITFLNTANETDKLVTNVTVNVVDNINPVVNKTLFPQTMALKPATFEIFASDNSGYVSAIAEVFYLNHSVWYVNGTMFERYDNISCGKYEFVAKTREHLLRQFEDTERLGTYYVHYNVSDINNNTVQGIGSFDVLQLDAVHYNKTLDIGYVQTGYEIEVDLLSMDFDIPVDVSVRDIRMLDMANISDVSIENQEVYLIGIKDASNNKKYFKPEQETITVSGTGKTYLIFSSNKVGRIVGTIQLQTVAQHVPMSNITFSIQTIDFAPPYEKYEHQLLPEVHTKCNFENSGNLQTSKETCVTTIGYPYFLSAENIPVIKNLKEIEAEQALWQEIVTTKESENNSLRNLNIGLFILLFVMVVFFLARDRVKETLFLFD